MDSSSVVLQQSLRNQEQAFINFFEGGTSYTSFKRKHGTRSARDAKAALWYDADTRTLSLAKMPGTLKVNGRRGSSLHDLRGELVADTVKLNTAEPSTSTLSLRSPWRVCRKQAPLYVLDWCWPRPTETLLQREERT